LRLDHGYILSDVVPVIVTYVVAASLFWVSRRALSARSGEGHAAPGRGRAKAR
jgi:hypothetical protein